MRPLKIRNIVLVILLCVIALSRCGMDFTPRDAQPAGITGAVWVIITPDGMLLNKAETTLAYPSAHGAITLPSITAVANSTFYGCDTLTSIAKA